MRTVHFRSFACRTPHRVIFQRTVRAGGSCDGQFWGRASDRVVQRHGPPRSRQRGAEQGGGAGGEVRRGRRAGLLLRYVAPDRRGSGHPLTPKLSRSPRHARSTDPRWFSTSRYSDFHKTGGCCGAHRVYPRHFHPSLPSPPSLLRSASRPVPDRVGERPAQHPPPARERSGRRRRPPGGAHPEAHPARDQGDRACRISKSCHPLTHTSGPYRSLARLFSFSFSFSFAHQVFAQREVTSEEEAAERAVKRALPSGSKLDLVWGRWVLNSSDDTPPCHPHCHAHAHLVLRFAR